MPIVSKYQNEQIESLMQALQVVLDSSGASPDLALLTLGNLATHLINTRIQPQQRERIAQSFSDALIRSVKVDAPRH